MSVFPFEAARTLRCDTVGTRFEEGAVDLRGGEIASVEVREHPASPAAWTSAEAEIQGAGVRPEILRAFGTAQTISPGTTGRRNLGDATVGVAADKYLDAKVSTAEANVWLQFQFFVNSRSRSE